MSKNDVAKKEQYGYDADLWGNKVSEYTDGKKAVSAKFTETGQKRAGDIFITVSVRQAGFYGSQQQCEIAVDANSNLLRALDKERARGKDAVKLLLNGITKEVEKLVISMVS